MGRFEYTGYDLRRFLQFSLEISLRASKMARTKWKANRWPELYAEANHRKLRSLCLTTMRKIIISFRFFSAREAAELTTNL